MSAQSQIDETKKGIKTVIEFARSNKKSESEDLLKAANDLDGKLKKFSETLNPTPAKQGIADRSAGLTNQVMWAVMGLTRAGMEPISQAVMVKYEKVRTKTEAFLDEFNNF